MLKVYTIENSIEWDAVVCSFREYDTYWLSGYVKAFQLHGDGEPMLFYYEDKQIRGINVVMKRDVAELSAFEGRLPQNEYYDICSPYGYGGWLIEGTQTEELYRAYESWCTKNNIICEFVRFHPILENQKFCTEAYDIVPLGKTVALDLSSPEVIWSNITSKNRNMIRKAQKNGICIYSGRYPQIFKEFRTIYNSTMDKDKAVAYYYFGEAFYESILNDLPHNAQVFYAVYEDKIIAASIMLAANGRMNYHLSGSLREYAHLAPTNLLLYEAAMWGWANGCKTLYLGGGVGSGEDSLYKFKKAFYRLDDVKRFHIGKKVFLPEKYNQLVQMRETADSSFFPKYRA